MVKEHVHVS